MSSESRTSAAAFAKEGRHGAKAAEAGGKGTGREERRAQDHGKHRHADDDRGFRRRAGKGPDEEEGDCGQAHAPEAGQGRSHEAAWPAAAFMTAM